MSYIIAAAAVHHAIAIRERERKGMTYYALGKPSGSMFHAQYCTACHPHKGWGEVARIAAKNWESDWNRVRATNNPADLMFIEERPEHWLAKIDGEMPEREADVMTNDDFFIPLSRIIHMRKVCT